MSDHKKKGDFDQWREESKGGDKKQHDKDADGTTGASKQNGGHGGHK